MLLCPRIRSRDRKLDLIAEAVFEFALAFEFVEGLSGHSVVPAEILFQLMAEFWFDVGRIERQEWLVVGARGACAKAHNKDGGGSRPHTACGKQRHHIKRRTPPRHDDGLASPPPKFLFRIRCNS